MNKLDFLEFMLFQRGKSYCLRLSPLFYIVKKWRNGDFVSYERMKINQFYLSPFLFFFGFTIPLNLFLQLRNFLIYSIQFNIQDTTRNFINISIQPNDTQKTLIFITKSQVKLKRDNHNGSSQCSKKANDLMIKPTQLKRYEKTNHQKTKLLSDISNCL